MMEKPIHQCWGQDNLDDQKQNVSRSVTISLTQINLELSVLSGEKQDIIIGHSQMLCHDVTLTYKYMFCFTLIYCCILEIRLIVGLILLLL